MERWFNLEAEPVPASRPRVTRNGVAFYPKRHTQYQQVLKQLLSTVAPFDHDGPVEARFLMVMPPYKTSSHPVHRADVDNLAKLPMDEMTSVGKFWTDDCMVSVLMSLKRFAREGEEPHTKVRLIPITESPEDYVDRMFES